MFAHIDVSDKIKETWKRVEVEGKRYYTVEGKEVEIQFPSITTVLGVVGSGWLEDWKKSVGEENASRISRKASRIGSEIHKCCENYLKNKNPFTPDNEIKTFGPTIQGRFNKMKPTLNRINNIIFQEHMMGSRKLGIGGTVDCIAEFDGVISIIDFKTSSRIKTEDEIESYFAQCAAYAVMMYEMTGIMISNIVIVMSVENSEPLVFIKKIYQYIDYLKETKKIYDDLQNRLPSI